MPRRFHPLIEERLPLIADATTWDEMDPAWGAPYGPPEEWDLVIEDADVDGPHGTWHFELCPRQRPAANGQRAARPVTPT